MKTVGACGVCCVDIYNIVSEFPLVNSKTRSQSSHIEVGGNATNVLTILRTLSSSNAPLSLRLTSMIGDDLFGHFIVDTLKPRIDVSCVVRGMTRTPLSQILVSGVNQSERTIIHSPATLELAASDLQPSDFVSDLDLLFLDGRQLSAATELVKHVNYDRTQVYLELERVRDEKIFDLIAFANYVECSENFIDEYIDRKQMTDVDDKLGRVLAELYVNLKRTERSFVVVTLGEKGSILLTKREINSLTQARRIVKASDALQETSQNEQVTAYNISIGDQDYVLYHCLAYTKFPVVDTTGAGDAFNAAVIHSLISASDDSNWNETQMLQSASVIAATICSELGIQKALAKIARATPVSDL